MTSRARRPIEPITSPSAVHDAVETNTQSASAGSDESGGSKSSSAQPTTKPNVETSSPLTKFGSVRPMKSAKRLAGRRQQRRQRLRPALAADRHRHPVDAGHAGDLHRVADDEERVVLEPRVAADVREEEDLEDRAAEHRRDVDAPVDPVEQRAVREVAADEEDPEVVHVSERVARSRASVLEVADGDRADDEVDRAEGEAHPDRGERVAAAERGVADRAYAPGRREHPRERRSPSRAGARSAPAAR